MPKIFLYLSNDNVANENTRVKQGEAKVRDTKYCYREGFQNEAIDAGADS